MSKTIFSFFMNNMFIIDMLLASFLIAVRLPRRKLFWLRLLAGIVCCITLSYYGNKLNALIFRGERFDFVRDIFGYLIQFALIIAGLFACFRLSLWKALFAGAAAYFIQHASYDLESVLWPRIRLTPWVMTRHYLLLSGMIAVAYLIFLRRMKEESLDKVNIRRVGPIAGIILVVCIVLNLFAIHYGENNVSFYLADLACNIVGLFYHYSVLSLSAMESEKEKIQKLFLKSVDQYEFSKENINLINIKCHDLRHQIRSFHDEGKLDGSLLNEIEKIVNDYDCTMRTGNAALDVILTEKSLLCKSRDIRFTCIADGKGLSYMDPYDVYALFGNALENAAEAAEKLTDPEKRFIGLTVRAVGNFYSIHLQNCVSRKVQFDEKGMPVTDKKDRQNHGFGVRSMSLIAEKYGGELSYRIENGLFNLNMILPYRAAANRQTDAA